MKTYQERKEYYKKRYIFNKDRLADLQRDYHKKNREIIAKKHKVYRKSRMVEDKIYRDTYKQKNRETILKKKL